MSLNTKTLKWLAPVLIFPVFVFFVTGSLTDIILMNRGVSVDGTTTDVNIDEKRIVYEYSFDGKLYRHEFQYVGDSYPTPLVGKKWSIVLDPQNPGTHSLSNPLDNLRTNLFGVLLVFLGTLTIFVIAASNAFRSPFTESDKEAMEQWERHKNKV